MNKDQIPLCKICKIDLENLLWDLLELGKTKMHHDKICAYICEGCFYKELAKPEID